MSDAQSSLRQLLLGQRDRVHERWLERLQSSSPAGAPSAEGDARQARELLQGVSDALAAGADINTDLDGDAWQATRRHLEEISRARVRQGYSSDQTATFVFSLKQALFSLLQQDLADAPGALAQSIWETTELVDRLGLYTVRAFQRTREDVIVRQQQEMLELSTPVVKLWDGILALPMIGTLDSSRTQVVMESLLTKIVETGAEIAIIDITGVPTVDTLVAQHLLKTVTAIRLMGAECIISGVRPQIAQTIVHLGIDLQGVQTKSTLADALRSALKHLGIEVGGRPGAAG
jgi:rsbT co-antagonist protein RsbR